MARFAHVTGWGMAVPERVMTNDDIAKLVDTSDEWIRDRTGISERRIAGPEETTGTLATSAALRALNVANLHPRDVDLIFVARRIGPLIDSGTEASRRHVLNHLKTDVLPPRPGVG